MTSEEKDQWCHSEMQPKALLAQDCHRSISLCVFEAVHVTP